MRVGRSDGCRNIYLKLKKAGGMKITFAAPPKKLDEKMLYNILKDYKMLNCEVLVRDENGGPCEAVAGHADHGSDRRRLYRRHHEGPPQVHQVVRRGFSMGMLLTRSLYVYNKIDSVSLDFLDKLAREPHTAVMSCELDLGIQDVVERCWRELRLIRIYTKRYDVPRPVTALTCPRKGNDPDFSEALIVRNKSTIEDVCDQVHRTLKDTFKYALVWGASARHVPQRVGLGHVVADEDVVSIVAK